MAKQKAAPKQDRRTKAELVEELRNTRLEKDEAERQIKACRRARNGDGERFDEKIDVVAFNLKAEKEARAADAERFAEEIHEGREIREALVKRRGENLKDLTAARDQVATLLGRLNRQRERTAKAEENNLRLRTHLDTVIGTMQASLFYAESVRAEFAKKDSQAAGQQANLSEEG